MTPQLPSTPPPVAAAAARAATERCAALPAIIDSKKARKINSARADLAKDGVDLPWMPMEEGEKNRRERGRGSASAKRGAASDFEPASARRGAASASAGKSTGGKSTGGKRKAGATEDVEVTPAAGARGRGRGRARTGGTAPESSAKKVGKRVKCTKCGLLNASMALTCAGAECNEALPSTRVRRREKSAEPRGKRSADAEADVSAHAEVEEGSAAAAAVAEAHADAPAAEGEGGAESTDDTSGVEGAEGEKPGGSE